MTIHTGALRRFLSGRRLFVATVALFAIWFSSCSDDGPTEPSYEFAGLEAQTGELVNQHRISNSLGALTSNDVIVEQARLHSKNMAEGVVPFSHEGFENRVSTISQKVSLSRAGENVAYVGGSSDAARTAVNAWLNSPGHKANIEGDFNLTGIGVARSSSGTLYFTQIFVRTR